jgi:undecaprenyl-diphosphatase
MDRRARDIMGLAVGTTLFVVTAARAHRGVGDGETRILRSVNGAPDGAFPAVWAPMQYGTFATVPALAGLALARRHPRLAASIAIGGTGAWLLAKAAKPVVDRGRPTDLGLDVTIRGTEEGGRGFPSGHAAVSASLTVILLPQLTPPWRAACAALGAFVPVARVYVGVHLPLDVLGGSGLGLAVGSLVDLLASPKRDT